MATDGSGPETIADEEVVTTAAEAAEGFVFSRYARSSVRDLDVTVSFEERILDIDVYLNVAEGAETDPERVAEQAARAGEAAVDELLLGE